ncbi:MAG: type II secretion system protein [Patescibacteria group bacterium]
MSKRNNQKGFTLIELLVVIAIIGLLSSVVLASLNTARLKARDTAIKSAVIQYRTLLEQEFNDTGSYANLQKGWADVGSCSGIGIAGTYAAKAIELCNAIVTNSAATSPLGGQYKLHIGTAINFNSYYSVMAWLPSKGAYFCVGSGGATSERMGSAGYTSYWDQPGCYSNP